MKTNCIMNGDCIEHMKELPENSVDAIITDPPYGLEFMGKEWDKFKEGKNIAGGNTGANTPYARSKPLNSVYQYQLSDKREMQNFFFGWATECLRVLKAGGFLLSFGGTRTYHRLVCGIEDAGFEIRDTIMWLYGSGFPKSLNIGKQIDKIQGNVGEIIGRKIQRVDGTTRNSQPNGGFMKDNIITKKSDGYIDVIKINNEWEGWGTALKPACEPIVVARKPLSEKNVALNVLKWGTGGINIDACRVGNRKDTRHGGGKSSEHIQQLNPDVKGYELPQGRFPANIILDEEAGKMLDEQSGISNSKRSLMKGGKQDTIAYGDYGKIETERGHNDSGGASRFFYCAKASKSERNYGCENLEGKPIDIQQPHNSKDLEERYAMKFKNNHPTVKPVSLMEYLVKLVSKPKAIILDPFIGSGTTAIACLKLNRFFIGIEKEPKYIKIANARIKPFLEQRKLI